MEGIAQTTTQLPTLFEYIKMFDDMTQYYDDTLFIELKYLIIHLSDDKDMEKFISYLDEFNLSLKIDNNDLKKSTFDYLLKVLDEIKQLKTLLNKNHQLNEQFSMRFWFRLNDYKNNIFDVFENAINIDPSVIQYAQNTEYHKQFCLQAVKLDGMSIQHIETKFRNKLICKTAIKQNRDSRMFVKDYIKLKKIIKRKKLMKSKKIDIQC